MVFGSTLIILAHRGTAPTVILLFYKNKNHLVQLENGSYSYKLKASAPLHTARAAAGVRFHLLHVMMTGLWWRIWFTTDSEHHIMSGQHLCSLVRIIVNMKVKIKCVFKSHFNTPHINSSFQMPANYRLYTKSTPDGKFKSDFNVY